MNLLTEGLPESIEIGGREYPINTDYRVSISFENIAVRPDLSNQEKMWSAMYLYFPEVPDDLETAAASILDFYRCGRTQKRVSGSGGKTARAYSFEHDDQYIFSAFMQQYGIDLTAVNMHWWKFRALFNSLSADTLFVKIMGWRTAEIDAKAPAAEKKRLRELKELYALPRFTVEDEKLSEIEEALMGDGKISGLIKGQPAP